MGWGHGLGARVFPAWVSLPSCLEESRAKLPSRTQEPQVRLEQGSLQPPCTGWGSGPVLREAPPCFPVCGITVVVVPLTVPFITGDSQPG